MKVKPNIKPNIEDFIDFYFKEHSNKLYNLFDNKKKNL